jgi:hypothetical protein
MSASRTAEYEADERSTKERPSVVKDTHTTHPADAECAASATAETHQPGEFVTITVTRNLAAWWASWVPPVESNFFERQIQAACRAALKAEK